MNNQKKLIVMVIAFALILILSSSYAILRSSKISKNSYVINVGDLKVVFNDGQTEKLNLSNIYPMSDEEGESQEDVLSFTIENTGTIGSYYDISIEELSNNPEFKSVIKYISNKDDKGYTEPKVLSENKYIDLTGYIESGKNITYKVKAWLAEEADNTYMGKTFKAKITLNAYQESNYAKDVIKSKLVKYSESSKEDFTGGLVAVNTVGELYNETDETQEIREYRYSGSNVNNYVTFNDETWRIIGVFKDEYGNENVKILRNEYLDETYFPTEYQIKNVKYKIKLSSTAVSLNYITGNNDRYDWVNGGMQYYLNTKTDDNGVKGYLSFINDDDYKKIENTKYYLGNVGEPNTLNEHSTTIAYYNDERKNDLCLSNITLSSTKSNCYVWYGNQSTWIGKIGLPYPSDFGYSANQKYWSTIQLGKGGYDQENVRITNWMSKILNNTTYYGVKALWCISPSENLPSGIATILITSRISTGVTENVNNDVMISPTLYLKSNVKITSGDGTQDNQYKLAIE